VECASDKISGVHIARKNTASKFKGRHNCNLPMNSIGLLCDYMTNEIQLVFSSVYVGGCPYSMLAEFGTFDPPYPCHVFTNPRPP